MTPTRRLRNGFIRWGVRGCRRIRYLAAEIPGNHGKRATGEIAQSVGKIGVVALYQRIE